MDDNEPQQEEEVSTDMVQQEIDISANRVQTHEEDWLNRELPIDYQPAGYRTRSKGPVTEESWIMD